MRYFKVMTLLLLIRLILLPQSGEGFQTEVIRLRLIREIKQYSPRITWSYDGNYLLTTNAQGNIFLWNTKDWELKLFNGCGTNLNMIAWSPEQLVIALGCRNLASSPQITTIDEEITLIKFNTSGHPVTWSPDGSQLAVLQPDTTIGIIEAVTFKLLYTIGTPCIVPSPVDGVVATSTDGGSCSGGIFYRWSPDGDYIGVAHWGMGTLLAIWDVETRQVIDLLDSKDIVWLQGGRVFALDDSIWETASMTQISSIDNRAYDHEASPDGQYLAYCVYNEQLHIMRAGLWADVSLVNVDDPDAGFPCQTIDMAWSTTGMIALAEQDGTIQIWEIVTDPPTPSALAAKVIQCITNNQLRNSLLDQIATEDWQAFEQSLATAQNGEMSAVCGVQLRDMVADQQN